MSDPGSFTLFVPVAAKSDKFEEVTHLLKELAKTEAAAAQWWGLKYTNHSDLGFGVFATFATEEDAKAAEAKLFANADELLSAKPAVTSGKIWASNLNTPEKIRPGFIGLMGLLPAKPGKGQALRDWYRNSRGNLARLKAEPDTLAWYATERAGTDTFFMFNIWTDEAGKQEHYDKVAADPEAGEVVDPPTDLVSYEIVAVKV